MPTKTHVGANHRNSKAVHPKTVAVAQARSNARPHWDRLTRTLFFGVRVVKHFEQSAPNAELILESFEEQHWSRCIDDPLPPSPGGNRKRRLHETIQNLNRRLGCRLLLFRGDGFGKGIRWQPA